MLRLRRITSRIYHVSATTQGELGRSFLRFQEHYESPEWRGKVFTTGQFKAWYAETYGKAARYEKDWIGFNLPSQSLALFKAGLFEPLAKEEQNLLRLFRVNQIRNPFYIIGSQVGDAATLEHEICHGLYATEPAYRKGVRAVLARHADSLKHVRAHVAASMYHPSVHDDEVHAYVSASIDEAADWGGAPPEAAHHALRKLREKHFIPFK